MIIYLIISNLFPHFYYTTPIIILQKPGIDPAPFMNINIYFVHFHQQVKMDKFTKGAGLT
jgi:hypothetical protein